MPSLVRIELWDKLRCQSTPSRLGVLYPDRGDLLSGSDTLAVDDQESLAFAFSRVGRDGQVRPIVANLVARTIATVVWSDDSYDEWRVAKIDDGRAVGGVVMVTGNPLSQDLAEGADSATGKGYVSTVSAGLRIFDFAAQDNTATDLWDDYIIPACPSWVTRGTIDPTAVIPLVEWERLTPWALAIQARDALRRAGVSCELRLRRNGTTDYQLDLVTEIGASAATAMFHPRVTLPSLRRSQDTTQQATRLFVAGSPDPSGTAGILGRARWRVVSVNTGAKTLVLEDPNGGEGPIGFADQLVNAYLVRAKTARAFLISDSDPTTQTLTLSETPTMVADEMVEFRLTEPQNNNLSAGGTRYAISAVGAGTLTLSSNPITADDQFVDWYARVWDNAVGGSLVRDTRVSDSVAATDIITVASVAGVTTAHYVEFLQLDGGGEIPSYLEHPTYVQAPTTGYGVKVGDLSVERAVGVAQLIDNGWMRTWTTAGNPPDGWTRTLGAGATATRISSADFTRYGGFSQQLTLTNANTTYLVSPRFDLVRTQSQFNVSARTQIYFDAFANGVAEIYVELGILALNPDGSLGSLLAHDRVSPSGTSAGFLSSNASEIIATGEWVTLNILGLFLTDSDAPYGLAVRVGLTTGGGTAITCDMYIDTVEAYGFEANPDDIFEYGDATVLHQSGNAHLTNFAAPLTSYDASIADLERADPTTWARNALTLGASVRVVDPDTGIDTTERLLRMERNLLKPQETTLTLANRATLLPEVVQAV